MSKIPDKRRRKDLDLFVLALVDCGVSTPYELQKAAGLSQGATLPALQRLQGAGFLCQGKPELRGRVRHRITAEGRKRLKRDWLELVQQEPSGNLDADLRVALLALFVGRARQAAVDYLHRSAERNNAMDPPVHPEAEDVPPLARWYRTLRFEGAKSLHRAESDIIYALAQDLPKSVVGLAPPVSGSLKTRKAP